MGWKIRKTIEQLPLEIRERIQDGEDITTLALDPQQLSLITEGNKKNDGWTHLRSAV